jgi:cyanase
LLDLPDREKSQTTGVSMNRNDITEKIITAKVSSRQKGWPEQGVGHRWYEIVSVYGTTIKELIHEEFGDGIMSAIDFSMDIVRQPDPKGDRVNVVLSGKFLPYKQY